MIFMRIEVTMLTKFKNYLKANQDKSPIIVIAGPTASGKSDLAIELAEKLNGYIINADSRQIYKELKIGTAQPSPDSKSKASKIPGDQWKINEIEHLLYGYVSIFDKYALYNYQQDVEKILKVYDSDRIPFLVGGTGLYIDSVVFNYDLKKDEIDKKERNILRKKSVEELQDLAGDAVKKLNRSDRQNPHRLIRLIERGGEIYKQNKAKNHLYIVINPEKDVLEKRVIKRVDVMIDNGLIEENKQLRKILTEKGYSNPSSYPKAVKSIGYQEFNDYFSDKKSLHEVKEEIIIHNLQYAKRQKTWFKRHKDAIFI